MSGFENKKDTIKKAAKRVFTKFGYNKTTLDDIARVVGIKKNSLYYYFESKEVLFNEILVEISSELLGTLEQKLEKITSSKEKLDYFILFPVDHMDMQAELNEATLSAVREIGELVENSYTEIVEKFKELGENILRGGIETGEFIKHDTKEIIDLIFNTINGYECKFYSGFEQIELMHKLDKTPLKNQLQTFNKYLVMAIKKK